MGAPKQKWTAEEELALKAGIAKYGAGKWSTILKDPEFRAILRLRSNVDLKDKWRNLRVTASGFGSREKARIALKSSRKSPKQDDSQMALDANVEDSAKPVDVKPLAMSTESPQITAPKRPEAKLETLILEAITNLQDPTGSNEMDISMYIEDHYESPPDFQRVLARKLKRMRETGKLVKVKHKYRIPPSPGFSEGIKIPSSGFSEGAKVLPIEGQRREPSRVDRREIKLLNKPQIDADLARMRLMNREEAAAAAAQAVAEAEVAMAEAEEAVRQAEAAEAQAEEAQAVADAAALALKNRNAAMMWAGVIR